MAWTNFTNSTTSLLRNKTYLRHYDNFKVKNRSIMDFTYQSISYYIYIHDSENNTIFTTYVCLNENVINDYIKQF